MKEWTHAAVKSESEDHFIPISEQIAKCFDPAKKSRLAFQIKKVLADIIKIIVRASPFEHTARQKLYSLKLIHKVVMMKNQEFNRYVENNLMQRFSLLARFNGRA